MTPHAQSTTDRHHVPVALVFWGQQSEREGEDRASRTVNADRCLSSAASRCENTTERCDIHIFVELYRKVKSLTSGQLVGCFSSSHARGRREQNLSRQVQTHVLRIAHHIGDQRRYPLRCAKGSVYTSDHKIHFFAICLVHDSVAMPRNGERATKRNTTSSSTPTENYLRMNEIKQNGCGAPLCKVDNATTLTAQLLFTRPTRTCTGVE